jgi:hypothetical protein
MDQVNKANGLESSFVATGTSIISPIDTTLSLSTIDSLSPTQTNSERRTTHASVPTDT